MSAADDDVSTSPRTVEPNGARNGSASETDRVTRRFVPRSVEDGWVYEAGDHAANHPVGGADPVHTIEFEGKAITAASGMHEHGLSGDAIGGFKIRRAAKLLPRALAQHTGLVAIAEAHAQLRAQLKWLRWATDNWRDRALGTRAYRALIALMVLFELVAGSIAIQLTNPLVSPLDAYLLMGGAGLGAVLVAKVLRETVERRQRLERNKLEVDHPLRVAVPVACEPMPYDLAFMVKAGLLMVVVWAVWYFGEARGGGLLFAVGALTAAASGWAAMANANEVADVFEDKVREEQRLQRRLRWRSLWARSLKKLLATLAVGGQGVEMASEKVLARREAATFERSLRVANVATRPVANSATGNGQDPTPAFEQAEGVTVPTTVADSRYPAPPEKFLGDVDRRDFDGVQTGVLLVRDAQRLLDGSRTRAEERAAEQEESKQEAKFARCLKAERRGME